MLWGRKALIKYKGQMCALPSVVLGGNGPSLFRSNRLEHIKLELDTINTVHTHRVQPVTMESWGDFPEEARLDEGDSGSP